MERVAVDGGVTLAVRLEPPPGGARVDWTLLYLHGFGSKQSGEKGEFFRARALAAGLPFCSFDFRGHGGSDGRLGELTFGRTLEDLDRIRGWLAERGHERVVLFGSSMGGATALAHAARRPAGVAACLTIAPAIAMERELERWAGPERFAEWQRAGTIRFTSELVEVDLGWEIVEELRRHDFQRIAGDLGVPALVVQGRQDASVDFREVLDFVARTRPGLVDLVLWGDGDHRLLDRRSEIWKECLAFLARRALLPSAS